MKQFFGLLCMLLSQVFWFWETKHFGSNWAPQTLEELLCDATAAHLFVCGAYIFFTKKEERQRETNI